MAIPTHLNSCSSVWKRRAHTELVGGPQAWPQPMYSSGVWCLVTTGVWEVGGLPPLETLEWQNTRTLTGFQKWRAPSKSTPTAPYFSSSQTERASESVEALLMPPECLSQQLWPGARALQFRRSSWYSSLEPTLLIPL